MKEIRNNQLRKSLRLKNFDYSQAGYYFVTICSFKHKKIFSKIVDSKIELNDFGKIVDEHIRKIPSHFPNAEIDHYCIMPNHIHMIIVLNDLNKNSSSLSFLIRSFKSSVTKRVNEIFTNRDKKLWQRNFYDHIIRNDNDLFNTRKYIEENPLKWEFDKYNK